MTAFTLPPDDGKPLEIIDYKINLLSSPPEIQEEVISSVDNYVYTQPDRIEIIYKNAVTEEGRLNIYLCKFQTGKFRLHIFGKLKGQEFRAEREISEQYQVQIFNERVKYVLVSSRNILRSYYLKANLQSMENHLMAFLVP
ncbi:MAG: hypothetical protein V4565_00435 [Bacteroidota bacterium]